MKKEWADKWVAALRSGNYVQGKHCLIQLNLHTADAVPSFCCLGVLCDLAKDAESVQGKWEKHIFVCADGSKNPSILPEPVRSEAGLGTANADLQYVQGFQLLAITDLNDTGKTFEEIAQVIEQHWEQL